MRINLGSGYRNQEGYTNIDNRYECDPDIVCDITEGIPYKDSTVHEVRAYDILEHIPIGKTSFVINEIWRVLVPDGLFKSMTPSTDGRGAFQDPTHVSFWNINSWLYYTDDNYRDLYGTRASFTGNVWDEITDRNLRVIHTFGELYANK